MHINIPATIDGSFYDGNVFVVMKESVFEPSTGLWHCAKLYSGLVRIILVLIGFLLIKVDK